MKSTIFYTIIGVVCYFLVGNVFDIYLYEGKNIGFILLITLGACSAWYLLSDVKNPIIGKIIVLLKIFIFSSFVMLLITFIVHINEIFGLIRLAKALRGE